MSSAAPTNSFPSPASVKVRNMLEVDAPGAAKVWRAGLSQTSTTFPWFLQTKADQYMQRYGDESLADTGDLGPNGKHLFPKWRQTPGREMFVAVLEQSPDTVVGLVGVKKGKDFEVVDLESDVASIWRMSVDLNLGRRGIGHALMIEAERWAVEQGCKSMFLYTANAIAGDFYCHKCGFQRDPSLLPWWKHLMFWDSVHYVGTYSKSLVNQEDNQMAVE